MKHNTRLTSAEIACLWTQYMSDSMAICTLGYMKEKAKDTKIKSILEFGLSLSAKHLETASFPLH